MPSHIHLLLALQGIHLGDFMRDFKKYTAQKSLKELARSDGGVWMPRYDRVGIRTLKVFETKLIYIHENPVRAGLVERVQDWKWSSARVYLENADSDIPVWTGWR
ncbi:MAG: transposase [Candidatus Zixiibacteriota bacterium]